MCCGHAHTHSYIDEQAHMKQALKMGFIFKIKKVLKMPLFWIKDDFPPMVIIQL